MGDIAMSKGGPPIKSVEEMIGRFQGEIFRRIPDWTTALSENPDDLESLERDVQSVCMEGASHIIAGLLAIVMKTKQHEEATEATRKSFRNPLRKGRNREIQIRLLGGLIVWVNSLYCAPRKKLLGRDDSTAKGAYVELAQFGFAKGVSPGIQSQVARQAALCPSYDFARDELKRQGLTIDKKTVRRITRQCGEGLLVVRKDELRRLLSSELPAGTELVGKRVSVQLDGGRSKIRSELRDIGENHEKTDENGLVVGDVPGRSKQRAKRTFDAEWREPKLMTIFIHDENGRMVKKSLPTIDGTFKGPDAIAEIVAMHLHRLGAAQAESITFVGDGAQWIWDRIAKIVKIAGLTNVTIHQVLDNCHAVHHVSLALAQLGLNEKERLPLYRELRSQLRNGQWRQVIEELEDMAEGAPDDSKVHTEIAYLRKHGDAGRLDYTKFNEIGIPGGSGAIESSIRRVINLRLKSNGIFWRAESAEEMLQVRCQVISRRWDERLKSLREFRRQDNSTDWTWKPRSMRLETEAGKTTDENPLKTTI